MTPQRGRRGSCCGQWAPWLHSVVDGGHVVVSGQHDCTAWTMGVMLWSVGSMTAQRGRWGSCCGQWAAWLHSVDDGVMLWSVGTMTAQRGRWGSCCGQWAAWLHSVVDGGHVTPLLDCGGNHTFGCWLLTILQCSIAVCSQHSFLVLMWLGSKEIQSVSNIITYKQERLLWTLLGHSVDLEVMFKTGLLICALHRALLFVPKLTIFGWKLRGWIKWELTIHRNQECVQPCCCVVDVSVSCCQCWQRCVIINKHSCCVLLAIHSGLCRVI